jgi:hypothetical protein
VIIDGARGTSVPRPNIIRVNGANQVTVNGFTVRHYNGNGVFVVNVDGYKLTNLVATLGGVYGVYAFNSKGGEMSNSTASYNNDSGFYIGQTPPQSKPKRSLVANVKSYGNVLGFSGTRRARPSTGRWPAAARVTRRRPRSSGSGTRTPRSPDTHRWSTLEHYKKR